MAPTPSRTLRRAQGPATSLTSRAKVGLDTFADVQAAASQVGSDTFIDLGGEDSVTLLGVSLGDLSPDDLSPDDVLF